MREIIAIAMRMDNMKILCEIPFKDKTPSELDVSGENLGMEGALVIAEYLDGNGTISSVNLLKNDIPVEQAQELVKIMQSKEKLIALCGLKGEEATLDFSNQGLGPGDAVLIANDISHMRAISKFAFSGNSYDSKPVTMETSMVEADFREKGLGESGAIIAAAFLPKCTEVPEYPLLTSADTPPTTGLYRR
jgi:hypothetical protein